MAESYPLSLPTVSGFTQVRLVARSAVGVSTSPFSYKEQVYRHPGQRWEAELTIPPLRRESAEEWLSFLMRLRGRFGTFLLGDPLGATPRGSAATVPGTPLVNGADQTGDELAIDGLPTSETGYLLAGDYIQLGSGGDSRLYKVLENVNTNASGEATLNIWPALRSSPADNASVTVSNAKGLFRLASNETDWDANQLGIYGATFACSEAL